MAIQQPITLYIDRGDARTWALAFYSLADDGVTKTPLDLTGWTLSTFDVSASLVGKVSVAWTDAATGKATLSLQSIPDLRVYPKSHSLRVLRTPPDGDATRADALPLIWIFAR